MKKETLCKMFPAFGTINTITLYDKRDFKATEIVKQRALELHRLFSFFEPGSDVYHINKCAGIRPVSVAEDTFKILSLALSYEKITAGAFSIAAGASAQLWRDAINSKTIPLRKEIEFCRSLSEAGNLVLNSSDNTAYLQKRGQLLDLGAIAKGYAADEARRILESAGVKNALINFGGTLVAIGRKHKIGIKNPFDKVSGIIAETVIKNKSVVTSGCYERCFSYNGETYHHIIDPRTGEPSKNNLLSVTLIGKSAAELDALATAAYISGKDKARSFLNKRKIKSLYIAKDGKTESSPFLPIQYKNIETKSEALAYD